MNTEKTIFEKIVAGEIPCYKVYEDADTFAFLDIQPHSAGHTLVIPKKPFVNIHELPNDVASSVMHTVKKVADSLKKTLNCDGIKILMNNGAAAGQIVFHAHVHIIPRYKDKTLPKKYTYKEGEAAEIANKIAFNISNS